MKLRNFFYFFILLALLMAGLFTPATAQGIEQWTLPRQIPNYDDTARAPFLAADRNRTVHAFSYEAVSPVRSAIVYRKWSVETGWSPRVDIILPDLGSGINTIQGAFADNNGVLHLIYYNGAEKEGDIMYSRALASIADRATSWSVPIPVGKGGGPLPFAGLTGDENGRLLIVYSGQINGIGLYQVHSEDSGNTWSEPSPIYIINEENLWPSSIRFTWDDTGQIHMVWSIVNDTGVGTEVHYARTDPSTYQWTNEIVLARREEGEYSTQWPSIITNGDDLIVIYQDSFPATRWMVRSQDGGETWQLPVRPFPQVGEYENAILLKDGSGTIHMILGNRTSEPEIHGMWHSRWLGDGWAPLEPLISGPITPTFDPSAPQAIISQGNVLLATWWHNVRKEDLSGAWYSYAYLDAPELPVVPLPSPTPISTRAIEDAAPGVSTNLNITPPAENDFASRPQPIMNPATPIFIGLAPVAILIGLLLVLSRRDNLPR